MNTVFLAVGEFLLSYPLPFLLAALLVNLIAFVFYGVDKYKAKKQLWRIPEATLILFSVLGGGIGSLLGMTTFRHKTKHTKFLVTVPLFFLLYTAFFAISLFLALLSSYGA